MGNSVAQPLRGVAERPAGECARIVSAYVARSKCADFEFGAGLDDVQSLTASSKAEAADICELLTRNKDSNQVNVLVLLAAACLVCEADTLAVPGRASLVYDVFNFDADSDLSRDELTILLMCVFRAMNCVSDHAANDPNYALMDKLASTAFGNEQRETMRKDDFVLFVKGFCSGADDFPA
ncbi:hypothetical protein M885DRAFT_523997 [Pelagophyceae sp. CCMP2097]|nr:hypothetical protein M885DRAFT_523997 [Pelagophyceae sp. CCMP2097]